MYSSECKAECSAVINPVFNVKRSFKIHSDLLFKKDLLFLSMLKTLLLLNIFVETVIHVYEKLKFIVLS